MKIKTEQFLADRAQAHKARKKAQKQQNAMFARAASAFIPFSACSRELEMQVNRRRAGLKTGHYVKWPDPVEGPQIVLAKKAKTTEYVEAAAKYMEHKAKAEAQKQEMKNAEGKSDGVGQVDGNAESVAGSGQPDASSTPGAD